MSTARDRQRADFLDRAGWGRARRVPLAGDASARRYDRLTQGPGGGGAVLMDAPPDQAESTLSFVRIARHLRKIRLSAPEVYFDDAPTGFVLLEDFGDALFAREIARDTGLQTEIYETAVEALVHLHRYPAPGGVPAPGPGDLARMTTPAWQWYRPGENDGMQAAQSLLHTLVAAHSDPPPVLVLRDFHAENLVWLPERHGPARVGLLDFQDAMAGHRAYDLVSLTKDARRDVPADLAMHLSTLFARKSGLDRDEFAEAAAIFAAQRNLRIVGVFARLCLRDGKPGYVDLIPRVWQHLLHDLSHPALARLREILRASLPEPTPEYLAELKSKCRSRPAPS